MGVPRNEWFIMEKSDHGNWEVMNGNFRVLKWRYVSTISYKAIFCGDISPYIGLV